MSSLLMPVEFVAEDGKDRVWLRDGLPCAVRWVEFSRIAASILGRAGHYNGYVAMPADWVDVIGMAGNYLDVHVPLTGGITYTGVHDGWCVVGFDCNHFWQERDPRFLDGAFIAQLVNDLADAIRSASRRMIDNA